MPEINTEEFQALKSVTGNLIETKTIISEFEKRLFIELEPLGIGFIPIEDFHEIAEQLLINGKMSLDRANSIQQQEMELTGEEVKIFISLATEQRAHGYTEIWTEELSNGSEKLFLAIGTSYDSTDHLDNLLGVYEELASINDDVEKLGQLIRI